LTNIAVHKIYPEVNRHPSGDKST